MTVTNAHTSLSQRFCRPSFHPRARILPALVTALLGSTLLLDSQPLRAQVVDLSECRAIEDRLERFACYEGLDNGSQEAAPARETAPGRGQSRGAESAAAESSAAQEAQPRSEIDDFGRESVRRQARIEENEGRREFVDSIARLEERAPNTWLVILESGQQWQQVNSKRYPLRVGEEVRIYPTRWGKDYRLSSSRLSSFIQVRRLEND